MTTQEVLARFKGVIKNGEGWKAICPAHADAKPSLSVSGGAEGVTLIKCFGGCETPKVLQAVGLSMRDLFPSANGQAKPKADKKTWATLAEALAALSHYRGVPAGQWVYRTAQGEDCGAVLRWDGPEGKTILPLCKSSAGWQSGAMPAPRPLYRLPQLLALPTGQAVYIVEGEKVADFAAKLGLFAVTSAGGSQAANQTDWTPLAGRSVCVLPDADTAGEKYAADVAGILSRLSPPAIVRIVGLPGLAEGEDLCEFMSAAENLDDIKREVERLAAAAPVWGCPPTASETPATQTGYACELVTSDAFANGNYKPQWLVKRLLVKNQPAVVGGPKKCLKTSVIVDLAVSLAGAIPFLSEFTVYKQTRVALLSGESGEWALQETARRVCSARGVDFAGLGDWLYWGFRLPQLANSDQLAGLQKAIKERQIEVLLFDPLYLALLAGQTDLEAQNLFHVGPLLLGVGRACLDVGCTPVLIHHTKKFSSAKLEPLDLDDLAYSGIPEFARQWLLISRAENYEPGSGEHRLWVSAGGSCGQGGLWLLSVAEGQLGDDFTGRKWETAVTVAAEARQEQNQKADQDKKRQREVIIAADAQGVVHGHSVLDPDNCGLSFTKLRDHCDLSNRRFGVAVAWLIEQGQMKQSKGVVKGGKGAKQAAKVLTRCIKNDLLGASVDR